MTIDDLRDNMECNGYAYFDRDAFFNQATKKVCYIPENAETLEECYTYLDLRQEVVDFCKIYPKYLLEHETTIEDLTINMFENIEWTFPSTWLDELNH